MVKNTDRVMTPEEKQAFFFQMAIEDNIKKGYLKVTGTDKEGHKIVEVTEKGKKHAQEIINNVSKI